MFGTEKVRPSMALGLFVLLLLGEMAEKVGMVGAVAYCILSCLLKVQFEIGDLVSGHNGIAPILL